LDAATLSEYVESTSITTIASDLMEVSIWKRPRMGVGLEERGRHLLGQFRGAAAEHPLDSRFAELVDALRSESPKFATWWLHNRVEKALTGQIAVRRPPVGIIRLDVTELTVAAQPSLTLCVQVPRRPSDKSKLAQIV
jgi:hypothetical protein